MVHNYLTPRGLLCNISLERVISNSINSMSSSHILSFLFELLDTCVSVNALSLPSAA